MAKKKLFKSKGNFTIKRLHQSGNYGKIFERDYTTVSNTYSNSSGQIPIYTSPSFKLTVRGGINEQKKYHSSNWINNPQSCNPSNSNIWTLACMPTPNNDDSKIVLKPNKSQLTDYVCYGSAYELIKASLSDIILKFPGELYISDTTFGDLGLFDSGMLDVNSVLYKNNSSFKDYYVVENPFAIDIIQSIKPENTKASPLRYICETQYDYTIIDDNGEIIVDGNELKKWNEDNPNEMTRKKLWNVRYPSDDKNCLVNGDLIASACFWDGIIRLICIECFYFEGDIIYLSKYNNGFRIRPNKQKINEFFIGLDDFEKILLNPDTNYTANFDTYIENEEKGWYSINKSYKWPIDNGEWNLAVNGRAYSEYIQQLTVLANGYDTLFTDAIWNNMTHEAISNMDLTKKINSYEDVIYNPAKMRKFLNVIGRQFDEIKKYIDNIKNTNTVSYDGNQNIPDYFIPDVLNLSGWETKSILNNISDDIRTETMYESRAMGYKASDANNEFMKRLKLNSKNILSSKGTKRSIEDLLAIFGFHSTDWIIKYHKTPSSEQLKKSYILKQYVYVANGYNDNVNPNNITNEVKKINQLKDNYSIDDINNINSHYNEYQGIPVTEVMFGDKIQLIPWFDKNSTYDNDMYFQMKGGWSRNEGTADETSKYEYTVSKTKFVYNFEDLYEITYNNLNEGDIYYVNNDNTYYKLIDIDNHDSIYGWKGISPKEKNEIESIIDNNKGNNPHQGNYDGGQSYFNLMRNFFSASEFNNAIDSEIENKNNYGFKIKRQEDNIKTICYNNNTQFLDDYNGLRGKMTVSSYNFFDEINSPKELYGLSVINSKEFHIVFDITYRDFIENDVLPYLKQIIPSTAIFSYSFENIEEYTAWFRVKADKTVCDKDSCPIFDIVE